ncbi:MAG: polysaccharide biosynthesis protein [bacterium]|jgi:FlaA1/EpsC-like NDP-sugar epimerase
MFIGASRTLYRGFNEIYLFNKIKNKKYKTIIIGAGNAGEKIAREIFKSPIKTKFNPVGYIDDDKTKHGKTINGIIIIGGLKEFKRFLTKERNITVIIAMPSISQHIIRNYVNICLENKIPFNKIFIIPPVIENLNNKLSINDLREIQPEDILGREEFDLPQVEAILNAIKDKIVMVTGAGGSIGSTIVKKVSSFKPKLLILYEIDETEIFFLIQFFNEYFPDVKILPIVGDIRDEQKIARLFNKNVPDIIFHAAAYKHVPIMEFNIDEAVTNNIHGTDVLCKSSIKFGVKKFVLISTDKAVNPSNIMGSTKRIAEAILSCWNNISNKTEFISVRFGNVLGSRGSVIPIFKEQIKNRKPLTITHPEMERFLMSIDEAVLLILYSITISKDANLFFLDMGKKIKILDIAHKMIKFYGLTPDKDVKIIYTGIRPGEKLTEEITYDREEFESTSNKKIFKIISKEYYDMTVLREKIDELVKSAWNHYDNETLRDKITNIISIINTNI